jgi:hypothetical protein
MECAWPVGIFFDMGESTSSYILPKVSVKCHENKNIH